MSAIYPVILCGGSGARLWTASRADQPKLDRGDFQFSEHRAAEEGPDDRSIIVDLRNVYKPGEMVRAGFTYASIGRG